MENALSSPRRFYRTIKFSALSLLQNLQQHRVEHLTMVSNLFDRHGRDRARNEILQNNIKAISNGVEEVETMIAVSSLVEKYEKERQSLRAEITKFREENKWLRDEVSVIQKELATAGQTIAQLEEEKNHLEFMLSMKAYDDTLESEACSDKPTSDLIIELLEDHNMSNESPTVQNSSHGYESTGGRMLVRPGSIHRLIIHYASQSRFEVAVPLCKLALEEIERTCGRENADFATMCNILALVYRDQNKYKESTELLKDALMIREKIFGESHSVVAATLSNLAVLYGLRGRYEEAVPYSKRALEISENAKGKDHPDVAKQLNNLALLCQNQNKYKEVEKYYMRAIEIYESRFGHNDPNVAKTKNNLASCYMKQGEYYAAELLYKQVLTRAHEKEYGPISESNKSIWQIAEDREMLKMKDVENIRWNVGVGVDSTIATSTMKNLGALYRKQGKHIAANILGHCALRSKIGSNNGSPNRLSKKEEESYKYDEKQ